MGVFRTPEERFINLPGFPYAPKYVDAYGTRVHYVDEGEGQPVLFLHGEPTWSYLYRKMIPRLACRHRVLAMDFIGFGRSDKFTGRDEYSLQMHCDTLKAFVSSLSLEQITVVVHDWGSLVGLRTAAELPDLFARLVILNSWLPTGDIEPTEGFLNWRRFVERTPDLAIGRVVRGSACGGMPDEVTAAYDAPFPSPEYKAGAQVWPLLVPLRPDDPGAAEMRRTREALSRWNKPAYVLFSDRDPIVTGWDTYFRGLIPKAALEPATVIRNAGHFLQEDKGGEVAGHILAFLERRPMNC